MKKITTVIVLLALAGSAGFAYLMTDWLDHGKINGSIFAQKTASVRSDSRSGMQVPYAVQWVTARELWDSYEDTDGDGINDDFTIPDVDAGDFAYIKDKVAELPEEDEFGYEPDRGNIYVRFEDNAIDGEYEFKDVGDREISIGDTIRCKIFVYSAWYGEHHREILDSGYLEEKNEGEHFSALALEYPYLEDIIITADPHISPETKDYIAGFYAEIEDKRPGAIAIVGDLADKSEYLYLINGIFDKEEGRYYTKKHNIPVFMVPGNHDAYFGTFEYDATINGEKQTVTAIRPYTDDGFKEYEKQIGPTNLNGLDFVEKFRNGGYYSNGSECVYKLVGMNSGADALPTDLFKMYKDWRNAPDSKGVSSDQISALKELDYGYGRIILLMHHPVKHTDVEGEYIGNPSNNRDALEEVINDKYMYVASGHVHAAAQRHYKIYPNVLRCDEIPDVVNSAAYVIYNLRADKVGDVKYLHDRVVVTGAGPAKLDIEVGSGRASGHMGQTSDGRTIITVENGAYSIEGDSIDSLVTEASFPKDSDRPTLGQASISALALKDGTLAMRIYSGDYNEERDAGEIYLDVSEGLDIEKGQKLLFKFDKVRRSDNTAEIDFDGDDVYDQVIDISDGDLTQRELNEAQELYEAELAERNKPKYDGGEEYTTEIAIGAGVIGLASIFIPLAIYQRRKRKLANKSLDAVIETASPQLEKESIIELKEQAYREIPMEESLVPRPPRTKNIPSSRQDIGCSSNVQPQPSRDYKSSHTSDIPPVRVSFPQIVSETPPQSSVPHPPKIYPVREPSNPPPHSTRASPILKPIEDEDVEKDSPNQVTATPWWVKYAPKNKAGTTSHYEWLLPAGVFIVGSIAVMITYYGPIEALYATFASEVALMGVGKYVGRSIDKKVEKHLKK